MNYLILILDFKKKKLIMRSYMFFIVYWIEFVINNIKKDLYLVILIFKIGNKIKSILKVMFVFVKYLELFIGGIYFC